MPLMRNPFRSAKNPADHWTEPAVEPLSRSSSDSGLEATSADGSIKPLSMRMSSDSQQKEAVEYQLSEINDSGVFLPPSAPEKTWLGSMRSFGSSTSTSTRSTARTTFDENEPFSISRESFDSYRRSFDISARSPIVTPEAFGPRHSLDVRRMRLPGAAPRESQINPPSHQPDDRFEDVGLEDDAVRPTKRGFLSRFGGAASEGAIPEHGRPASSGFGSVFGRKKALGMHESELRSVAQASEPPASGQT